VTIPFGATITVTVVRPAATDGFGDPTGTATETAVSGCSVWQDEGAEDTTNADTVTTPVRMVAPADTDLRATDRVIVAGLTYEVVGEPVNYRSPFTAAEFLGAYLRRVTG
jgi:hypothetical protein